MGTNYYVKTNQCLCCGRYDQKQHIGKSSWGWAFTFQGYIYDHLTSWKEWKTYLKENTLQIVDEYGQDISFEEFVEYVEGCKSPGWVNPDDGHENKSHYQYMKNSTRQYIHFNPETEWEDEDGYSFTSVDFS